MAWLKKRSKIWYIVFRDEKGKIQAFSTKTQVKKEALYALSDFEEGKKRETEKTFSW